MDKAATGESKGNLAAERLRIEWERVALERRKLALEMRLRKRDAPAKQPLLGALSTPIGLAVLGGFITLLTQIVSSFLTSKANRESDERRASQARDSEARLLQSELLKAFLDTDSPKIARDNLTFLVEAGLIPDHEGPVRKYLDTNKKTVPRIGDSNQSKTVYPPCVGLGAPSSPPGEGRLGVSLHLATNALDANAYGGWDSALESPESDARSLQELAASCGFRTHLLLGSQARSDCLSAALSELARTLRAGDTLLVTFSGHGSQVPASSDVEDDGLLEAILLFDAQVTSDELYGELVAFASGVTVVVVTDASHGMVMRRPAGAPELAARVVVVSGCREDEYALDNTVGGSIASHGAFTGALLDVWNSGAFEGSYCQLIDAVASLLRDRRVEQRPQLHVYGPDPSVGDAPAFSR